jgi:hypothetical protein
MNPIKKQLINISLPLPAGKGRLILISFNAYFQSVVQYNKPCFMLIYPANGNFTYRANASIGYICIACRVNRDCIGTKENPEPIETRVPPPTGIFSTEPLTESAT